MPSFFFSGKVTDSDPTLRRLGVYLEEAAWVIVCVCVCVCVCVGGGGWELNPVLLCDH